MSNRRKLRPGGSPEIERCDRCGRPAAHVLVVPAVAAGETSGYEVLACGRCWPLLERVMQGLGGTVLPCGCGRC